jgi:hypothetical protein
LQKNAVVRYIYLIQPNAFIAQGRLKILKLMSREDICPLFDLFLFLLRGKTKNTPSGVVIKNKNAPDADAYAYSYFEKLLKEGIRVLIRKLSLFLSKSLLVISFASFLKYFVLRLFKYSTKI